ncbi:MAG: hypothetical protein ACJAUR_000103 [Ulvibacter sp.]|jgi:hypothetical protein
MKNITTIITVIGLMYNVNSYAQNIISPCGYTVSISLSLVDIIPSTTVCPWGYNYDVSFSYTITIAGINTCWNGNIEIAPRVTCGSKQHMFWSLIFPAPAVGDPFSSISYTGTTSTNSSPWVPLTNCATATPSSMGCTGCSSNISNGPGLSTGFYPCSFALLLPIDLVSFAGSYKDNSVFLNWTTVSESNNDYFTIERTEGGQMFEEIGTIEGANNSTESIDYSFTDNAPLKDISYYRLKQTDFDGNYSYSKLVNVDSDSKTSEINIYPNPNSGNFSVEGAKLNSNVIIFSPLGREIYNSRINSINTEINLGKVSSGVYFIEVRSESESAILKFNVIE